MQTFLKFVTESAAFPKFKGKTLDLDTFANSPHWQRVSASAIPPKTPAATTGAPVLEADGEFGIGINQRTPPEDEMQAYLQRIFAVGQIPKGKKKPEQSNKDRFMMPNIHNKILKKVAGKSYLIRPESDVVLDTESAETIDVEDLKKTIKARPKIIDGVALLSQNKKMIKSAGPGEKFVNFGIPALTGIVVNEKTNKFTIVTTCPGAGMCKMWCYALKGGYVQYVPTFLKQARILNFLMNDPLGFFRQLDKDIKFVQSKARNKQLYVRWHDAGDFFSDEYLRYFFDICRKNPMVRFYAYTKIASVMNHPNLPDNFVLSFSAGSSDPSQEKQVDLARTKKSVTVPLKMFEDLTVLAPTGRTRKKKGKIVIEKKWKFKTPADEATFRERMVEEYKIDPKSILNYKQLMTTPLGNEPNKWNVIVMPGDGDNSAARRDVHGTYLLFH